MAKLSIIIPVYNVEKYLKKCLNSVINQTLQDLEIICVNDGSTDNSLEILNEFAQKDNRIKIISQKNGGLSCARNTGLKHASAKLVTFIDSDDWIEPETYELAYNAMVNNDADYVVFKVKIVSEYNANHENIEKYLDFKYSGIQNVDQKVIYKTPVTVWNKIFKSSIIKEKNIWFPEGCIYEDNVFWLKYAPWCKRGCYLNECLYNYLQRKSSITGSAASNKSKKIFEHIKLIKPVIKYYNDYGLTGQYSNLLVKYFKGFIYTDYFQAASYQRAEVLQMAAEILNCDSGILNKSPFIKAFKKKQYSKINFIPEYGLFEKIFSIKKTPNYSITSIMGIKFIKLRNHPQNIKILVCYHKKDKLFKNEMFVPIHCGREIAFAKSKDGTLNTEDYKWLEQNMIGDNTGDNISHLNRYINEMTAVYWAWKNYDKLGNPDFIGLNHYRRFFTVKHKKIYHILDKYYFISSPFVYAKNSNLYKRWININLDWADNEFLTMAVNIIKQINPTVGYDFEQYLNSGVQGGWCNMFVMPREEFFRYCEFIFPVIFELLANYKKENRTIAMFCEYLTSFYLYNLKKQFNHYDTNLLNLSAPPKNLLKKIFSIENKKIESKQYKIITIIGIKIKFTIKKPNKLYNYINSKEKIKCIK